MMAGGGGDPIVEQVYAAGAKKAGGNGWSLGTWIIIGIAILSAILIAIFIVSMIISKRKKEERPIPVEDTGGTYVPYRGGRRLPLHRREYVDDYEGEYDPNPSRYDREEPPAEMQSDYDAIRRRNIPDYATEGEQAAYDDGKKERSGLGERRVLRGDGDGDDKPTRRVRFSEDVRQLVQSKTRRPKPKSEEEKADEDVPEDKGVEKKLMRRGSEGRVLSSTSGDDRYSAPSQQRPGRTRSSPATERDGETLAGKM